MGIRNGLNRRGVIALGGSTCSADAFSPAITRAGSDGITCDTVKTMTRTPNNVGGIHMTREAIIASILMTSVSRRGH